MIQTNIPRYGNVFLNADTFADLRSISTTVIEDGYSAIVKGGVAISDGLGGLFAWNAAITLADDGQTVIAPQDGQGGRWVKIGAGQIGPVQASISDYGASPHASASANTAAIQAAVNAATAIPHSTLDFGNSGDYALSGTIVIPGSANGLRLQGRGTRLTIASNAPILSVSPGAQVTIDGLSFVGNDPTGSGVVPNSAAQQGVIFDGAYLPVIRNCHFENLGYGMYWNNTPVGYQYSGAFQLPALAHGNTIRNCYIGVFFRDSGTEGTYGEYTRFENNLVIDCLGVGCLDYAGNTSINNNTFNGNGVGAWLIGAFTSNGDHGSFCNNTVNHNLRCGLYIDSNLRSWVANNNNIWACLGGAFTATTGQTLGQISGTADGTQNHGFGVYFNNVHNIIFVGNHVSRNQVNMATKTVSRSIIAQNQFTTDSALSVGNTWDYSPSFYTQGNKFGPNVYDGSWTGTTEFPHNGNWNRWIAPVFQNGWSNFGGTYPTARYSKDENGDVRLAGLIKGGNVNQSAFTVPPEYTPSDGIKSFATFSNNALGIVQVGAGTVTPINPSSNVDVSLDGITYSTTND